MSTRRPHLSPVGRRSGAPSRVLLYLHGGNGGRSTMPAVWWWPPVLLLRVVAHWMRPEAKGTTGYLLRYRLQGWNGGDDPLSDARWALAELHRRHPDVPIVLVGHSMGGRVAAALVDDRAVCGWVGLAPWLDETHRVPDLTGRRVALRHGDADRTTSPAATVAFAERAAERGAGAVDVALVPGGRHSLLQPLRLWRDATRDALRFVLDRG